MITINDFQEASQRVDAVCAFPDLQEDRKGRLETVLRDLKTDLFYATFFDEEEMAHARKIEDVFAKVMDHYFSLAPKEAFTFLDTMLFPERTNVPAEYSEGPYEKLLDFSAKMLCSPDAGTVGAAKTALFKVLDYAKESQGLFDGCTMLGVAMRWDRVALCAEQLSGPSGDQARETVVKLQDKKKLEGENLAV